jgi:hypothetical protein
LLSAGVAAVQCDLCVVAVILNEEPLAAPNIVRVRHKICPSIDFLTFVGGNRQAAPPTSKAIFA